MRERAFAIAGTAVAGLKTDSRPSQLRGTRIRASRVPGALRAFWFDGLLTAGQDAFIAAYLPLLAVALGASFQAVGFLVAVQNLGALLGLYPGAVAARRFRSRRRLVLWGTAVGRICLLLAAGAVALTNGALALSLVMAAFMVRSFATTFVQPAWTTVAAEIVPNRVRARFFASRGFAVTLGMFILTPLGGLILDRAGTPNGYVISLLVSFALGLCASALYATIPEPRVPAAVPEQRRASLSPIAPLADPAFRKLLLSSCATQFGALLAGPFFALYLKEQIGGSNLDVGLMSAGSLLAGLAGQVILGDLMARRGPMSAMVVALAMMPAVPILWLVVDAPLLALLPGMVGGFAWAGFNLATFQSLLELPDAERRENGVALYHTCGFAMMFVAPFAGGLLAARVGFAGLFAISAAIRVAGAGAYLWRPGAGRPPAGAQSETGRPDDSPSGRAGCVISAE